jgi:hypothetical protein
MERLFGVLLHRAFSGELTDGWRRCRTDELLREMKFQAEALAIGSCPAPSTEAS